MARSQRGALAIAASMTRCALLAEGSGSLPAPYGRTVILRRSLQVLPSGTTRSFTTIINGDTRAVVAKGATSTLKELEVGVVVRGVLEGVPSRGASRDDSGWVEASCQDCDEGQAARRTSKVAAAAAAANLMTLCSALCFASPWQFVLDRFNLCPDNPLVILDQETSNVFGTLKPKSTWGERKEPAQYRLRRLGGLSLPCLSLPCLRPLRYLPAHDLPQAERRPARQQCVERGALA